MLRAYITSSGVCTPRSILNGFFVSPAWSLLINRSSSSAWRWSSVSNGIVYLEVARLPERGWVMATVGLAGKILGPIGLAVLIATGAWPVRTLVLCVSNDLIWWLPFGIYVVDAFPFYLRDLRNGIPNNDCV